MNLVICITAGLCKLEARYCTLADHLIGYDDHYKPAT